MSRSYFEIACKTCKKRTGPMNSWFEAIEEWDTNRCPSPYSRKDPYEVQSQEWGYEWVPRG